MPQNDIPMTARGQSQSRNGFVTARNKRSVSINKSRVIKRNFDAGALDQEMNKATAFKQDSIMKTARGKKKNLRGSMSQNVLKGIQAYKNRRQKNTSNSKPNEQNYNFGIQNDTLAGIKAQGSNQNHIQNFKSTDNAMDHPHNSLSRFQPGEEGRNSEHSPPKNLPKMRRGMAPKDSLQSRSEANLPMQRNNLRGRHQQGEEGDPNGNSSGIFTSFKNLFK